MNIEPSNMQRVRLLLEDLEKLESALQILTNYDATVSAKFSSSYNLGTKNPAEVVIPVSSEIKNSIVADINNRILNIKKELQKM